MKARLWTALNAVMLIAFLFSVAVQYNDPDPLRWILLYASAAVACVLEMRRTTSPLFATLVAVAAGVWAATILPHVYSRVHVAELFASFEMKNELVEEAREAGGLCIVAFWLILIAAAAWRRSRIPYRSPLTATRP
jgi:hypothetical protein